MEYLINGGKYAADIIMLHIDGQYIDEWYFDGTVDDYLYLNEIYRIIGNNRKHVITITGFQAGRGERITEELTIHGTHGHLTDFIDNTTISIDVPYVRPKELY